MKKIINKLSFALAGMLVAVPSFAEDINVDKPFCDLIVKMHGVFNTLRIMAFIGAAFYIGLWAWDYIKGGSIDPEKIKKQGVALVVGFALLILVGVLLSFVMSGAGLKFLNCPQMFTV